MENNFLSLPLSSEDRPVARKMCPPNGTEYDFKVYCDEWGFVESFPEALDFKKPKDRSEQYFWETVDYCRFRFVEFFQTIIKDFSTKINISSELSSIKFYGALPYEKATHSNYQNLVDTQRHTSDPKPTPPKYKGQKSLLTRPTDIENRQGKAELRKYLYNIRDSFMWLLQTNGIDVGEGRIRPDGRGSYTQKGVDVLMASEMVMDANDLNTKEILSPEYKEDLTPTPIEEAINETKQKVFLICTADNDLAYVIPALRERGVKIAWMPLQKNFNINNANKEWATLSDCIIKPDDEFIQKFRGQKSKPDKKLLT